MSFCINRCPLSRWSGPSRCCGSTCWSWRRCRSSARTSATDTSPASRARCRARTFSGKCSLDLSSSSQSVTELFARFPVSTVHNALNKYKGIGCSSMISSQLSRPHGFESRHPPKKCFKMRKIPVRLEAKTVWKLYIIDFGLAKKYLSKD